jgi:hypothetical protein
MIVLSAPQVGTMLDRPMLCDGRWIDIDRSILDDLRSPIADRRSAMF